MRHVLVIGEGQLGMMLAEAGVRLGVVVDRLHPEEGDIIAGGSDLRQTLDADTVLARYDVITSEREHFPQTPLVQALISHSKFPNADTYALLPDRAQQKTMLDELAIATAPWGLWHGDAATAMADFGDRARLKSRRGGYDGKGQWALNKGGDLPPADSAIIESHIDFSRELSLVGARNANGEKVFLPLVENRHRDGILRLTLAPVAEMGACVADLQAEAEDWLGRIMDHLGYVGVMAMELFDTDRGLLVNELAPRVHNSGHWSQDAASACQFELHLRALCNLPLAAPQLHGCAAMINIIGEAWDPEWLHIPDLHLHWYAKSPVRPGRKMGHFNLFTRDAASLHARLHELTAKLPWLAQDL